MIDAMKTTPSPPTTDVVAANLTAEQVAALERLAELRQARADLDNGEVVAVAAAKNLGLTYRQMAPHFGMTHQHMQHYFSPLLQTTRTVTVVPAEVPEGRKARRRPLRDRAAT